MWVRYSAAICAVSLAVSAAAETPEQLDQLVVAAATPASALQLAKEQAARGELLLALSTVERVMFAKPDDKSAGLMHVNLLCRLDDLPGAAVHIAQLKKKDYPRAEWQQAMAACGAESLN